MFQEWIKSAYFVVSTYKMSLSLYFLKQRAPGGFRLIEFSFLTLVTRQNNATIFGHLGASSSSRLAFSPSWPGKNKRHIWLNLHVCLMRLRSDDPMNSWRVNPFCTLNWRVWGLGPTVGRLVYHAYPRRSAQSACLKISRGLVRCQTAWQILSRRLGLRVMS